MPLRISFSSSSVNSQWCSFQLSPVSLRSTTSSLSFPRRAAKWGISTITGLGQWQTHNKKQWHREWWFIYFTNRVVRPGTKKKLDLTVYSSLLRIYLIPSSLYIVKDFINDQHTLIFVNVFFTVFCVIWCSNEMLNWGTTRSSHFPIITELIWGKEGWKILFVLTIISSCSYVFPIEVKKYVFNTQNI